MELFVTTPSQKPPTIVEDMTQVGSAACVQHLNALHEARAVSLLDDVGWVDGGKETGGSGGKEGTEAWGK